MTLNQRTGGVLIPIGVAAGILTAFAGFAWSVMNKNIELGNTATLANTVKIERQTEIISAQNERIAEVHQAIKQTLWEMKADRERLEGHVKSDQILTPRDVRDATTPTQPKGQ